MSEESAHAYHLNLLMESERMSSSPVRFRIMLPILAVLACLGIAVWWAILGGQLILAQASLSQLKSDLAAKEAANKDALSTMAHLNELNAELDQFECYESSILRRGEFLTALAEAMPLKVQLVRLEIPQQPPPPVPPVPKQKGAKVNTAALMGPTGYVEKASLVLTGRSPKELPIFALMDTLASETFTNDVYIVRDSASPSPRVRSFRQDASRGNTNERMVAFEIEYQIRGRRFNK